MSTLCQRLQDHGYKAWIKVGLCLNLAKEVLNDFADDKSRQFHQAVLNKLTNKSICNHATVNRGRVSCCSCNNCQAFVDEIDQQNQKSFPFQKHNWTNSDMALWPTNPWEMAKVFMNAGQKATQRSPVDTDLSGILNFIDHCVVAKRSIVKTHNISKVRDVRNAVMHSASMTLSQTDFTKFTSAIIDLLEDPGTLGKSNSAQETLKEIRNVIASDFSINLDHEMKVIKERIEALEQRTHTLETTVHEQSESLKGLESTGDRNVVQLKEEIRKLQNTQLEFNNEVEMLKERINTYDNEKLQVKVKNLDVLIKNIGSELQAITNKIDEIVERVTTLETQHVILDERVTALEQRESHTEVDSSTSCSQIGGAGAVNVFPGGHLTVHGSLSINPQISSDWTARLFYEDPTKTTSASNTTVTSDEQATTETEEHDDEKAPGQEKEYFADIETNPGPTDYPCGSCALEVCDDDPAVNLDVCGENILKSLSNPKTIPAYLREKGIWSNVSQAEIQMLQTAAEKEFATADFVWIGYDIAMKEMKIPVICAIYETFPQKLERQKEFLSFKVIQKELGDMSQEAKYVANYEQRHKMQFEPEELKRLQECLDAHTEHLMNEHSNLLIVSASKVKSTRYGESDASLERKACIVLYVNVKGIIPIHEAPFPVELDGIPVDVRESVFENYKKPDEYFEKLVLGCRIQSAYALSGTLGGFVELRTGELGCLTCCHVFKESEKAPKKKDVIKMESLQKKSVFQPSVRKEDYQFGEVIQCIDCQHYKNIGVDAALIKITCATRIPTTGKFPNAVWADCGFAAEGPMVFDSGDIIESWKDIPNTCKVVKYGATTELTIGELNPICIATRGFPSKYPNTHRTPLYKQIEVQPVNDQPFAKPGDSGALVFAVDEDQPRVRALGMLVGGMHDSVSITPIWAVLGLLQEQKFLNYSSSRDFMRYPLSLHRFQSSPSANRADHES